MSIGLMCALIFSIQPSISSDDTHYSVPLAGDCAWKCNFYRSDAYLHVVFSGTKRVTQDFRTSSSSLQEVYTFATSKKAGKYEEQPRAIFIVSDCGAGPGLQYEAYRFDGKLWRQILSVFASQGMEYTYRLHRIHGNPWPVITIPVSDNRHSPVKWTSYRFSIAKSRYVKR